MPVYSVGRRRVILALLLTSALLLTLDLRGNPFTDKMRDVAARVMAPIESAVIVVTNPIERAWNGIVNYDDVERENESLRDQVDRMIGTQASAEASVLEYQELRALFNLPSLAGIETEVAQVVGKSVNNLDQIVEIDKGRSNGVAVGMAVVNQAGLIGKVTSVTDSTARVRLITDTDYEVNVKIVSGADADAQAGDGSTALTPSGLTEEEVTQLAADLSSTTTSTTTTTTSPTLGPTDGTTTTLPGPDAVVPDSTLPGAPLFDPSTTTTLAPGTIVDVDALPANTTTTTSTTVPLQVEKEFGGLEGRGGDRLPQIRFIQDNPSLAVVDVGDLVFTAGGLASFAPPDIPVGRVVNRALRPGSGGPLLDVEPHADLTRLNYVRVVLYKPLSEVEQ